MLLNLQPSFSFYTDDINEEMAPRVGSRAAVQLHVDQIIILYCTMLGAINVKPRTVKCAFCDTRVRHDKNRALMICAALSHCLCDYNFVGQVTGSLLPAKHFQSDVNLGRICQIIFYILYYILYLSE